MGGRRAGLRWHDPSRISPYLPDAIKTAAEGTWTRKQEEQQMYLAEAGAALARP